MNCPTPAALRAFLETEIEPDARPDWALHVETCSTCAGLLDEMTRGTDLFQPSTPQELWAGDPARGKVNSPEATPETSAYIPKSRDTYMPDVPGYDVLSRLGRGGMGVVYRARHLRLNRFVALKMIRGGALADAEHIARFRAETQAVARLQHPNIVQIFEVGEVGDLPYCALELLEGGSLEKRLHHAPQPPRQAAELMVRLARTVHAAHDAGIVHRDLKPANILFTADGNPKVTDFGLAKQLESEEEHTHTGQIMGTPDYMAPEQALGLSRKIGPAADIYALGVILYEMLTGRVPLKGATTLETIALVVHQEPVHPQRLQPKLPRDLNTICLKCLAKDPVRRYANAAALADDLERWLTSRPILARPTPAWERFGKWMRREPLKATAAATMVSLLISGQAGWWWWEQQQQEKAHAEFTANVRLDGVTRPKLAQGEKWLQEGKTNEVLVLVADILPRLHDKPALAPLVEQAKRLQAEATRREATAKARFAEHEKYKAFLKHRENALQWEAGITGMDSKEARERAREETHRALVLYGTDPQAAVPAFQLAPLPAALEETEKAQVRSACFELLRLQEVPEAQARQATGYQQDSPARAAFLQGLDRCRHNEPVAARKHLLEALQDEPDHFWAHLLLAVCHLRSDPPAPQEAIASLTACLRGRSDFAYTYLLRGYAHYLWGKHLQEKKSPDAEAAFSAALADYRRAEGLQLTPEARYILHTNRGVLHLEAARISEAQHDLDAAIAIKPGEISARLVLARLREVRQEFDLAQAEYDRVISLQSNRPELYRNRAVFHLKHGQKSQALADCERAITLGQQRPPTMSLVQDYTRQGSILHDLGRLPEALAAYDAALALHEQHVDAHRGRLWVLLKLERHDELLRSCNLLLAQRWLPPAEAAELYQVRGLARAARRDVTGAVSDYTLALAQRPDHVVLLVHRGNAYLAVDAYVLALADFQRATKLDPTHAEARIGCALAHVRLLDCDRAITQVEEGLRGVDPKDRRLLYLAATVFAQAAAVEEYGNNSSRPEDHRARGRQYADRALTLLKAILTQLPEAADRRHFWQVYLQVTEGRKDVWYRLRTRSDFLRLERECQPLP